MKYSDDLPVRRARLTMQDRNVDVQEARLRNVRRRLFQEDDDRRRDRENGVEDNAANCFVEEARKHREEAKKRWNFDFEKEIPLPGNYEWVRLDRDGNEIPMTTEVQNKTMKAETVEDKEEEEEVKLDEEKEEDPPEEKEADADDKAEAKRQKDQSDVS